MQAGEKIKRTKCFTPTARPPKNEKMFRFPDIERTTYWFFLLLALTSCRGDGAQDIRNHYFPLRELKEGLVYEYQPMINDSLTPAYWYYRSFFTEEGIFLTKTYYEYELAPLQLSREEVVSNGMLLEDLYLYENDSTGKQQKITVEVLSGSAFPFQVKDSSGVFLYKIQWHPVSDPEATITLIKNRRYIKDTTIVFEAEERDAVLDRVDVGEAVRGGELLRDGEREEAAQRTGEGHRVVGDAVAGTQDSLVSELVGQADAGREHLAAGADAEILRVAAGEQIGQ